MIKKNDSFDRSLTPTEFIKLKQEEIKQQRKASSEQQVKTVSRLIDERLEAIYDSIDSLLVSMEIQIQHIKNGKHDIVRASVNESKMALVRRLLTELEQVRESVEKWCKN